MRPRQNNLATLSRRQALAGLTALPLASLVPVAAAQSGRRPVTPTQTLGPFYPRSASERPKQTDADLLSIDGDRVLTRGTPLDLTGRILDMQGQPLRDAAIEIWQCDANAVYHHPAGGAESDRDPHFQGYGVARSDADGRFHFRTLQPVAYPGRTPHIHVRVEAAGRTTLATQLYLANAPENARDFLFRRLQADEQARLTLALQPTRPSPALHPLARATRFTATTELVLA